MKEYKIVIGRNKVIATEVKHLVRDLGYYNNWSFGEYDAYGWTFAKDSCGSTQHEHTFEEYNSALITLHDLRMMLVSKNILERNQISDANYEDGSNKFFKTYSGDLYHFFDGLWIKCSSLTAVSETLKPIQSQAFVIAGFVVAGDDHFTAEAKPLLTDFRIKIDSNKMCEEAQELLFKLGKSWSCAGYNYSYPQKDIWLHTSATQIFWCHDSDILDYSYKEIVSIDDLREMLVKQEYVPTEYLDADDNFKYYKTTSPTFISASWIEIPNDAEAYWASTDFEGFIKHDSCGALMLFEKEQWIYGTGIFKNKLNKAIWVRTQPPSEPDPFLKEYLTPDFRLMLASDPHPSWIDVPNGARTALLWDEGTLGQVIEFYREDNVYFSNEKHQWLRGMNWQAKSKTDSRVIWQRDPQPVTEPDPFMKEYLAPEEGYALKLASAPNDGWIEVPDESVHAIELISTVDSFVGTVLFMNAAGLIFIHGKTKEFVNGTYDTVKGYVDDGDLLVWSRYPKSNETDSSDLPSSIEFAPIETVYHYSASINTARGSVSYDGVVTFTGRITGIEDYQKVRAEIAKDGSVAPDQVNIHSLTIVG
jgi:hypothetical protein